MEGHELRRLRLAHGLTQAQLADMLEISPVEVSRWEESPEVNRETRRLFLRALAAWREAQKKAAWLVILLSGPEGEAPVPIRSPALSGRRAS